MRIENNDERLLLINGIRNRIIGKIGEKSLKLKNS
jgi:hypothetical protein